MTGKKCVITGGAGFIGSYLAEKLLNAGFRVCVVDNLSTGNINNINHLMDNPRFEFHRSDVRNRSKMIEYASDTEWVFHFAALVGVKQVLDQPMETLLNNTNSTESVLNATMKTGSSLFLASSSEVYGESREASCSEGDILQIGNPYSLRWAYAAGKLMDEFMVSASRRNDQKVIIGRFFNIIGKRQNDKYGMVVPRFIQQATKHRNITIYGDGFQTRSFCDVRDAVSAVIKLCFAINPCHYIFNIGNETETSIVDLARKIRKMTKSKSDIIYMPHEMIHKDFQDIRHRKPDLTLLKSLTDWKPKYTLDESLAEIVSYRMENSPEYV